MIAVDPTSPYSGGAILGDRIRMRDHDADPGFYMRSMATRGSLGGLARASADVALVIEASGKQRLLLETVGVGQDEIDIVRLADVTSSCWCLAWATMCRASRLALWRLPIFS